jgi:hypothetical protein
MWAARCSTHSIIGVGIGIAVEVGFDIDPDSDTDSEWSVLLNDNKNLTLQVKL